MFYGRKRFARGAARSRSAKRVLRRRIAPRSMVRAGQGSLSSRIPIMFNPVPGRLHNIVAPRYFTDLEYGFTGNYQLPIGSGYQFSVLGNGLHFPGSTANSFPGTLAPATVALAALNPVGLAALSNLYGSYRVWESIITVSAILPLNSGGATLIPTQLVVLPTTTEEALADPELGMSLPYAKSILINPYGAQKDNTIHLKMDTRTIYGLSQAQQQASPDYSAAVTTNPANSWWFTIIRYATNNTATWGESGIMIRVNYRVEFFDPKGSESDQ